MKLRSIQFLRAIAAMGVVYAHSIDLQMRFARSFQQDFFYLQDFGAFGVDLFFVVSGFVICLSAARYQGLSQGLGFLSKRFVRVNPVYYLASAFVLLLSIPYLLRTHVSLLHGVYPRVLVKTVLILPFFDSQDWIDPLLFVGWTLCYEWLFYGQFFLAILLSPRPRDAAVSLPAQSRSLPWLLKGAILSLLIALPVMIGLLHHGTDPRWIFLTNPIQGEFFLGMLVYGIYERSLSGTRARNLRTAAILLLAVGIFYCLFRIVHGIGNDFEMYSLLGGLTGWTRLWHWGLPAAFLVAGATLLESSRTKASRRNQPAKAGSGSLLTGKPLPVRHLPGNHPAGISFSPGRLAAGLLALCGDASYSIYLTHSIVFRMLGGYYSNHGFPPAPDEMIFLQFLLALVVGILFYKWVETPLLRRLRRSRKAAIPTAQAG